MKKYKFLIIDDSRTYIELIRSSLINSGVCHKDITGCIDSQRALHLLEFEQYDVVLCDYNMSNNIDGGLIFEEIKRNNMMKTDGVFICMTGDNSKQVVTHFIELEPDDYLLKPFSIENLLKRLNKIYNRKKALQPLLQAVDEKKYQHAIDLCQSLREEHSKYLNFINRIYGDCLLRLKRHQEAKEFYQAECQNTDNDWPMIGFGNALEGLGELEQAEDIFQAVLAKSPCNPIARSCLARHMMHKNELHEALIQFDLIHKINPANPIRELVIANLYGALLCYDKAHINYDRFCLKVNGTTLYNDSIAVQISLSLMLASNVNFETARQHLCGLHMGSLKATTSDIKTSILAGLAILAYLKGEMKECYTIAGQVDMKMSGDNFYCAFIVACMYGFCGMPKAYEEAIDIAKKACEKTSNEILMISQFKLLEGYQQEISKRINTGREFYESASQHFQNKELDEGFQVACKAFSMVPYYDKLCFLILEFTAVKRPERLDTHQINTIILSCYWVFCHDSRPTPTQKQMAQKLLNQAKDNLRQVA